MKLRILEIATALVLFSMSLSAQDGAELYKKKCASCHGANGEGKPAMKAPAVKGTSVDSGQIVQRITKGATDAKAPHNKGMAGVTEKDATAIAEYLKTLQ